MIASDQTLRGMGAGQPNRVVSVRLAAEKAGDIETKVKKSNDELEQMRTLRVKPGSGLFAVAKDQVRIDDEIAREWAIENKSAFNVTVELPDGKRFEVKCSAKKGKGDQLEVGAKVLKDQELFEGQGYSKNRNPSKAQSIY